MGLVPEASPCGKSLRKVPATNPLVCADLKANCACVSVVYLAVRIYMYRSMKVRSIICLRYKHKEML